MKHIALVSIIAVSAAVITGPAYADFKPITSEAELRAELVGKKLYDTNGNWFRWNADGTMSGKMKDKRSVAGAWKWSQKYVCRNVRIGKGEAMGTDCQLIEFDGKKIRYTRDKGKGKSSLLTME